MIVPGLPRLSVKDRRKNPGGWQGEFHVFEHRQVPEDGWAEFALMPPWRSIFAELADITWYSKITFRYRPDLAAVTSRGSFSGPVGTESGISAPGIDKESTPLSALKPLKPPWCFP